MPTSSWLDWGSAPTQVLDRPDADGAGLPPTEPPTAVTPDRPRGRMALLALALAAVSATSAAGGAWVATRADQPVASSVVTDAGRVVAGGTSPTEQLAKVAAAVQPTVVSILVSGQGGSGEGSGVIVRSDGVVLTNNHVVESAADGGSITVKRSDGSTARATILGRDPSADLAVIKMVDVSGLPVATLGSSAGLHVGDTVLAIGSPLGLDGSVSAGIVSALHRTVTLRGSNPFGQSGGPSLGDAIQTDAAINPGNSGGALVDSSGRIVGINTAIATAGTNGSIGVGFAIPIDEAKRVMDALLKGQTPTHAVLGVNVSDTQTGDGALIQNVVAGGAAAVAGLQAGDVVTRIGETSIDSAAALAAAVRSHQPGDKVAVHYLRGGKAAVLTVTLASATG